MNRLGILIWEMLRYALHDKKVYVTQCVSEGSDLCVGLIVCKNGRVRYAGLGDASFLGMT